MALWPPGVGDGSSVGSGVGPGVAVGIGVKVTDGEGDGVDVGDAAGVDVAVGAGVISAAGAGMTSLRVQPPSPSSIAESSNAAVFSLFFPIAYSVSSFSST